MGYHEAVADGIRFVKNGYTNLYYTKCQKCGAEVMSYAYVRNLKCTCKACKLEKALADKEQREDDDYPVKEQKFANAIKRISKVANIDKYKNAIDTVHETLHTKGHFDSTEEIMVSIELTKNNITFRHQVKFGVRYKADFILPDDHVVLEVDGTLYHTKNTLKREMVRDDLIVLALGADWEVIRITDVLINENITRLVQAIDKVKEKRQLLREERGEIPAWYSDRKL